jgi:hypothetical protein
MGFMDLVSNNWRTGRGANLLQIPDRRQTMAAQTACRPPMPPGDGRCDRMLPTDACGARTPPAEARGRHARQAPADP